MQGEGQWHGYVPAPELPAAPEPGTWGEHPPMLGALAQAVQDQAMGFSRGAVLTAALARMGQALAARQAGSLSGVSA